MWFVPKFAAGRQVYVHIRQDFFPEGERVWVVEADCGLPPHYLVRNQAGRHQWVPQPALSATAGGGAAGRDLTHVETFERAQETLRRLRASQPAS